MPLWVGYSGRRLDRVTAVRPASARRSEKSAGARGISTQVRVYGSSRIARIAVVEQNNGSCRFDPREHSTKWFHKAGCRTKKNSISMPTTKAADGTLEIGGNKAIQRCFTGSAHSGAPPPRVVLTNAATSIDHCTQRRGSCPGRTERLALAYDDKLVNLEFARPRFSLAANNHYSYQLRGFRSGWSTQVRARGQPYKKYRTGSFFQPHIPTYPLL